LVVNAAKYVAAEPSLALNPDPQRVGGILVPFAPNEAGEWAARAAAGRAAERQVTMAKASLNDGQTLVLRSYMLENGVIFNAGAVATIGLAERKAHLLTKRWIA
jgi:hypothetical protein